MLSGKQLELKQEPYLSKVIFIIEVFNFIIERDIDVLRSTIFELGNQGKVSLAKQVTISPKLLEKLNVALINTMYSKITGKPSFAAVN